MKERVLLMLKRTITGAFLIVAMCAFLYLSHISQVMVGTCIVLAVFSVYELCRASGWLHNEVGFIASLLLAVGMLIWELPGYLKILQLVFPVAVVGFILMMLRQKRCSLENPLKSLLLSLTVILLYKAFPTLRMMENGLYYLGGAMILCAVTDAAAYLVGSTLGKHKLIPSVSPNKTVEGAVGGILFGTSFLLLLGIGFERQTGFAIDYVNLAAYSALGSVVGQFGDLCMSCVKRICGIKDFGNVFPGHGGVLDRFDSQLLVIPFTLLYCSLIGGFIL